MRVFGNLNNRILESAAQPAPHVGMGATRVMYSDRHACTVIEVRRNGREIVLQDDTATRTDDNGMSETQSYTYAPNPDGEKYVARLRQDGSWRAAGKHGTTFALGARRQYHDYGF